LDGGAFPRRAMNLAAVQNVQQEQLEVGSYVGHFVNEDSSSIAFLEKAVNPFCVHVGEARIGTITCPLRFRNVLVAALSGTRLYSAESFVLPAAVFVDQFCERRLAGAAGP